MVELRRTNREAVAEDGSPVIGRGYEVRDDTGEALSLERLAPGAVGEIAVVEATPTSAEQREAMKTAAFGVGRTVTLRADDDGVALLDKSGTARGGRVHAAVAGEADALLRREPELATWVCWEWLREDGRSGVHVALSRPEFAPQTLAAPPQRGGTRRLGDRRVWLALAALVVALVVAFGSCS